MDTLDSVMARLVEKSNTRVRQAQEALVQARIAFTEEARSAIGSG
ncbi:hypothetical protein [Streptomyces sp. MNP-20]|nr:hypothetical protein [Streptomyces sp. MNP-20]